MTAHKTDVEAEQLLHLRQEITRIAGALAELSMGMSPPSERDERETLAGAPDVSAQSVEAFIRTRRERARYLPADLFTDPAWDMMLDLLRSEIGGADVTVSDLSLAASVPNSTGLRWIAAMVARGLFVRERDPKDSRRIFIRLSPELSAALRRYFVEVVERPDEQA